MEISVIEKPRYRLIQPLYAGDQYISEGTEIEFTGTPNEFMECLNKAAEERMTKYLKTLEGGRTPRVEDVMYKAISTRPRDAAGELTLPHAVTDVPQMGNMTERPSPVKIIETPVAPTRVKKLMGTVVQEDTNHGANSL